MIHFHFYVEFENKKQTKKTTNSQIQRREWWLPEGGVGGGPNGSRGSEGKLSSYKVSESWNLSCETTTKFTERWQVCHPCGQAGHPQGVDSHYLQVCKLHGGLSLEAQGLRNEGMQILQTESVHLHGERASISPGRTQAYTHMRTHTWQQSAHTHQGCMCTCTNAHTHTCIHAQSSKTHTPDNVCTCTHTQMRVHTQNSKVHTHRELHVCICTYTLTHVHTHSEQQSTHTNVCTCTHTHTHVHPGQLTEDSACTCTHKHIHVYTLRVTMCT